MTERQRLEIELAIFDRIIEFLNKLLIKYWEKRHQVWMRLNRARRLEREELQK